MTQYFNPDELVWKALGDAKRRRILEELINGPKLTSELTGLFPAIGRTAVLRHIDLLKRANLIMVKVEGRERHNYINAEPIELVCNGWIERHISAISNSANQLKRLAESNSDTAKKRR